MLKFSFPSAPMLTPALVVTDLGTGLAKTGAFCERQKGGSCQIGAPIQLTQGYRQPKDLK